MAKSLDQILQELDAGYSPQRRSIQTRLDALPAQADAEIAGLKATQTDAFNEILGGARDRGMGFSGQPLAEQSRYTASSFLPAVARVRQSQNESRQSLFDALNNVNLQKNQFGQQIYQQGLDRDEQTRQFNLQQQAARRAAATNPFAPLFDPQRPPNQEAQSQQAQVDPNQLRLYGHVRELVDQVENGNGVQFAQILRMARNGSESAKQTARAFYELRNMQIPANFRSFL